MNEILNMDELKTDYWRSLSEREHRKPELDYDSELDTLYLYFAPIESRERIITHYVDQYVAFLFRNSDKQVIGMSFEYFMRGYLAQYANKTWRLSDTGLKLAGIKDFLFKVEAREMPSSEKVLTLPRPLEKKVQAEPVFA